MSETDMPTSETFIENQLSNNFTEVSSELDTNTVVEFLVSEIKPSIEACKVVALVGGAASGKSLLSSHLVEDLERQGFAADAICTDDYVIRDRSYRREHHEGSEPRAKYDFNLLNDKIDQIRQLQDSSKPVPVPTYDQASGRAIDEGEANYKHRVGRVNVLIVEGDFLEVTDPDLVIYLDVPDEQRLRNRIGRDMEHRSAVDEAKVIENFTLRQTSQHLPYTLPAAEYAGIVIQGNLIDDVWTYRAFRSTPTMELEG